MSRTTKTTPRRPKKKVTKVPVKVVLASSSPERRKLLRQVFDDFEVVSPQVEEKAGGRDGPEALAVGLARAKADDVARRRPDALVIAADTVVDCRGEIIGKPADRDDAVRILTRLTSHPHRVVTGLCVLTPDGRRSCVVSVAEIRMRGLSAEEIENYVDNEDVLGRAGAYGLKEPDPNIESLQGSRTAVMGLPLDELNAIIESLYPGTGDTE